MTYAGLTTADKPALLDAKANGFKRYVFRESEHAVAIVNIDLALAQIAEMETAQTPTSPPLTWNERINQMTIEEKVEWLNGSDYCRVTEIPIFECDAYKDCKECMRAFLNSPYTEGEKENG